MRLSLDGRRFIYVAGKAQASPVVTLHDVDGVEVALAPGHSPRWAGDLDIVFGPHADGPPLQWSIAPAWGVFDFPLPSGNSVAAAAGRIAVHRTDPRRILSNFRAPIDGATDPALSDDGEWLAYLRPDEPSPGVSSLFVERAVLGTSRRRLAVGAIRNLRFGSRTLVWEAGGGRIGGCADVANLALDPVEAFPLADTWRCYDPVPVWVPGGSALLVLLNVDDGRNGHKRLAEWGSLAAGAPRGWVPVRQTSDGPRGEASSGSGYEHDARLVDGGPTVRIVALDPLGRPEEMTVDVRSARAALKPPATTKPEVPPDIPWTPDPARTVDMLDFVTAAATARRDRGDGTGELWLHKSPERPDWGENWDFDADYIGFVEDRSTGTRMISLPEPRPKKDAWTNTTRDRWSPEQIVAWNAAHPDRPVGDYTTLPLAGYTWRGNRVWLPRHVTGRREVTFTTRYDWWDLPEFGGRWELHPPQSITIVVETGYGRINGHDYFARSGYLKPNRKPGVLNSDAELNAWGPNGWIAFFAYDRDGHEEVGARSVKPVGAGTGHGQAGPFVAARFTPTYPIYDAARERPTTPPTPIPPPAPEDPVIEYVELRNLEDRLEDTYWHHGKHPERTRTTHVNPEGEIWREHYFTRRKAGMNHEQAIRSIESQIDVIEGRPDRWAPAPGTRPDPGPAGPIGVAGRDFVVAGRRFRMRGCTMGAALRPGHDYRPALDEAAVLGFSHVRTFCGELPWAGQTLRDVYERLPGYLTALRERGLRLYPAYVTEAGRGFDLDAHVRELEALFAGRDDVGPKEAANEPWHPSQGGRLDAGRLRSLCAQMAGVKTAGAPPVDEGSGVLVYAEFSDFLGPHLNRGQDGTTRREKWDMVRRIREFELLPGAVLNNEMIGADEVSEFGRREADPNIFFTAGVLDGFIAGGVFHSQAGLWANPLGPNQRLCAEAYLAGAQVWPGDVRPSFRNSNVNGGWGDSPVQSHDTRRCVRAYSGVYGSDGRVIALGVDGDPGVRFGAGYAPQDVLAARPGVTVWAVHRG